MAGSYRTIPPMTKKDIDRFWRRVRTSPGLGPAGECWEWQSIGKGNRYGQLRLGDYVYPAHRVAYAISCGPIASGLLVRHKCDNPICVRPEHLELGTNADNVADKMARGRHRVRSAENHPGAKLTSRAAMAIRQAYHATSVTMKELARQHGVSRETIREILYGRHWPRAGGPILHRTGKRRGEEHHSARLTAKDVKAIRQRYLNGEATYADLGREFGMSRHSIRRAISRISWKHIT